MKKIILLLLAVVIIPSAQAQYKSLELIDTAQVVLPKPKLILNEKPAADPEDLVAEFAIGNLTGIAVGFGAGYLGYLLSKKGYGEWDGFGGSVLGFVAGHCAGSIFGVYSVGSAKNFSGNLGATILGGVAGTGAGITYLWFVSGGGSPAGYLAATFPTAGAMIGFNSTLYYKDKKNVSEIKESGTHFKIKNDIEVNVVKINFTIPKTLAQSLQF